jgi:hypothetical protein
VRGAFRSAATAHLIVVVVLSPCLVRWGDSDIEVAMLAAARNGEFPFPEGVNEEYTGAVKCRIDHPNAFRGEDVYLCALNLTNGARQWEWGALVEGELHTHSTDARIPTITGPWDPPW